MHHGTCDSNTFDNRDNRAQNITLRGAVRSNALHSQGGAHAKRPWNLKVQSAEGSCSGQGARPSGRGRAPDDDVAAGVAPLRRLEHGVERAAECGGGALRGQLVGREGKHERGACSRRGIV
eukprot:scaffold114068_cov54-Phaeocystis_antarctica.AAC.1